MNAPFKELVNFCALSVNNDAPKSMVISMNNNRVKLYSALLRFLLTVIVIAFPLLSNPLGFNPMIIQNALIVFMIMAMLSATIVYQATDSLKVPCFLLSLIPSVVLYIIFDKMFMLIIILNILDLLAFFKLNAFFGLILLALYPYSGQYHFIFILFTVLMTFLYYLIYSVINVQYEYIETTFKKERQLLNRLNLADKNRKSELNRTILRFENQRLQEKSELSQNLHDKIGHAINGSIFKLEGAKRLVFKDTSKSHEMIEDVIKALRESVDEIRLLLRNEKPSAELMNINKLKALFIEFTDKYDIETNFAVEGDLSKVPLEFYGVLFDNTIEALSNSLKYAKCTEITASLLIYNKILRYTLADNGVGAGSITENMGLAGIKERISAMNGNVIISGENGFELNMLIPIPEFKA
jgi:signal transduction histidine kinase